MLFRNRKTNKLYIVVGVFTNATNDQDGQLMVQYREFQPYVPFKAGGVLNDFTTVDYVREAGEFRNKFIPVEVYYNAPEEN